jgi:hypothetical protein
MWQHANSKSSYPKLLKQNLTSSFRILKRGVDKQTLRERPERAFEDAGQRVLYIKISKIHQRVEASLHNSEELC